MLDDAQYAAFPADAGPPGTRRKDLRHGRRRYRHVVETGQDVFVRRDRFRDHLGSRRRFGFGQFLAENNDWNGWPGAIAMVEAAKALNVAALADALAQLKTILKPAGWRGWIGGGARNREVGGGKIIAAIAATGLLVGAG